MTAHVRLLAVAAAAAVALLTTRCTPKTPVEASTPATPSAPATPKTPAVKLSDCPKFADAPNPGQVEDNYVIYRDFLRAQDIPKAYELWQEVYAVAPAADGQRNTVLTDGIYFNKYFASQTTDPAERARYVTQNEQLYRQIEECYPDDGSMTGRMAFDYFYEYPGMKSKRELYDMFMSVARADGMKAGDYILNPLASLTVDLHESREITTEQARESAEFILGRLESGKASAKTDDERKRYGIIEGYAPVRLAYFEGVQGFYDCAYYKDKYMSEFDEVKSDYVRLSQIAGYLRFGGCPAGDPDLTRVVAAANRVRPAEPERKPGRSGAYALLQEGKYREAVDAFEESYNASSDPERKAQYALVIAKVYYGNLKNFGQARKWARQAAQHKSGWGEPYILVGKLYASSGPLCGSGTGFQSQRVVWPAIDQWQRAKSVDASVAGEANRLIGRYAQYMPSADDGFMNGLKPGQSYTVDCWINESTTVRYK